MHSTENLRRVARMDPSSGRARYNRDMNYGANEIPGFVQVGNLTARQGGALVALQRRLQRDGASVKKYRNLQRIQSNADVVRYLLECWADILGIEE